MTLSQYTPSIRWLCLAAMLVLGVCPPLTEGVLCPAGVKYWDPKRAKCRPCTVCAAKDFVLYPCEVYRDTICGTLTSVVELLVQNEDNGVREGPPAPLDWSTDVAAGPQDGDIRNVSSTGPPSRPRALLARDGHVFVVALALAVMLVCGIVMIAIGIHMRRRKRIVALIDNEEILDRLSLHRGRFSLSGRVHPTDQMKYLVDLDHNLAMDRILEQRRQQQRTGTSPDGLVAPTNVYVDHVVLVNKSNRDFT